MSISFRPVKDSDINFLYSTILKSYRFSNPIARAQRDSDYYTTQSNCLASLFEKQNTKKLIACMDDDPDLIIGFMIYEAEEPTIHYIYVKAAFRSAGVATAIIEASGLNPKERATYYTHWTIDALRYSSHRYKLIYNPMLFSWRPFKHIEENSYERAE